MHHYIKYPLFMAPPGVNANSLRETTLEEAKIYFDWLLSNLDNRIKGLLDFFNEALTGTAEDDLASIGKKVAEALNLTEFSFRDDKGPHLTNAGYALAADMGLLTAKILLSSCPSIQWVIVKKPKNHLDFHQPVAYRIW